MIDKLCAALLCVAMLFALGSTLPDGMSGSVDEFGSETVGTFEVQELDLGMLGTWDSFDFSPLTGGTTHCYEQGGRYWTQHQVFMEGNPQHPVMVLFPPYYEFTDGDPWTYELKDGEGNVLSAGQLRTD